MRRGFLVIVLFVLAAGSALAETGILQEGLVAAQYFEVTESDARVEMTLSWTDRAASFGLILLSPNGTAVSGSVEGLEFDERPMSIRVLLTRRAKDSLGWEGLWLARLRCTDAHPRRPEVPYVFNVDNGVGLRIGLSGLGKGQRTGAEVAVTARGKAEGDSGAKIEACEVKVTRLGGQVLDVPAEAEEGVCSARFTWPEAGRYVVAVAMKGRRTDGAAFRGDRLEILEVRDSE